MTVAAPERLIWAVETLAVQPDDHILEIGCGHGVAASLICEKLSDGKLAAIDRSARMIEVATRRNQSWMDSGKAVFHTAALHDADFGGAQFDKIFAVNVNLFWIKPAGELKIIRSLLKPGGALYLFFEPPGASQLPELGDKLTAFLQDNQYSIKTLSFREAGVCVIAAPAAGCRGSEAHSPSSSSTN